MLEVIRQLVEGLTSPYYVSEILPYHLAMLALVAIAFNAMGKGGGR